MKGAASLTPSSVNAILRRSKDRVAAMIALLTIAPHPGKETESPSTLRRKMLTSPDALRCVGVLPIVAAAYSAVSYSQPGWEEVHSWLAVTEHPNGGVYSMLLQRQRTHKDWGLASIIQGGTAKRLQRAIAVSAKEGSKVWLASIPNLRVLLLARHLEANLKFQVVQKGLTHLREGGLYKLASLQAKLADDEARLAAGWERVRKMKLKKPRLKRGVAPLR